ncbi:MAG: hypothetical protein HYZ50_11200 [Deltaproteobacteria bacterium]|nr:hypothetical protein [Deltaproteobacteria bacterium]
MKRFLRWLDQRFAQDQQWLTAWTLMAFVSTLVFMCLIVGVSSSLIEKTGLKLVSLELAGVCPAIDAACPVVEGKRLQESAANSILSAWNKAEVLDDATRAQRLDFLFPFAYGALFGLVALEMWRRQPAYPHEETSIGYVALGVVAAGCDEIENLLLYTMLLQGTAPAGFALGAAIFAIMKFALLAVAVLVFLHAIFRQYFFVGVAVALLLVGLKMWVH